MVWRRISLSTMSHTSIHDHKGSAGEKAYTCWLHTVENVNDWNWKATLELDESDAIYPTIAHSLLGNYCMVLISFLRGSWKTFSLSRACKEWTHCWINALQVVQWQNIEVHDHYGVRLGAVQPSPLCLPDLFELQREGSCFYFPSWLLGKHLQYAAWVFEMQVSWFRQPSIPFQL